uniref:Cystatin domain-containing protein n=1 Tax=Astatotilapia calliptera TaxID=8154 RepID=A0AAX7STN2_ASTCA
ESTVLSGACLFYVQLISRLDAGVRLPSKVLTAAHFAVAEFNKVNAGEMFAYKTVAITSAKIQVVAGIKYILDMLLGQTVCSRNHAAADSEPCAFQSRRKASSRTGWCITHRGGKCIITPLTPPPPLFKKKIFSNCIVVKCTNLPFLSGVPVPLRRCRSLLGEITCSL